MGAFCATANLEEMPYDGELPWEYGATAENLLQLWGILLGFSILYGIIGTIFLEFIDRDKR
ncbi:MAG TPA: hypothetical protein IAB61_02270 [Candidatus Merdisoma merdipullorum]|nr:hypothetical protein [Candidatus Merdisoma merdipullorum]